MGANDPRGVANLDHRSMICRIYVGYHQTWLHTKYTGFQTRRFVSCFPYYNPMATVSTGVPYLDPRGMVGRIYKGGFLKTICKSSGSHGFREEDCFMFS